ncbi:MAG: tRNA (guanosine(37)-N1)-methyltransferase TrmD [Rickettsiales bacterium]|jgi:tRNA (guanine37-N1)-methyltransferase|nr:tRNA (guanosine(37)-N1)-methyltransferase TrmD [Rickettsiales bacterium]
MNFKILTIFPEMFPGTLAGGVVGRALDDGVWSYEAINIRNFATDSHKSVDDAQFGGGAGMVMLPQVLGAAIDSIRNKEQVTESRIIYFSPRGRLLNQKMVREFTSSVIHYPSSFILICGRYEGIDQRIIDEYGIEEVSIGDYILSGGEIAAQVFIDSCVRLMDNVVRGGKDATANESFEIGGLEWPLYTRPSVWRGRSVPEVLLSGHHGDIERWRKKQSDDITKERRPDLLKESGTS